MTDRSSEPPVDAVPDPGVGAATAQPRAMTLRAVAVGLFAVVGVALLTPYNDWYLKNTFMYSQHLPVGVFLLVVLMGVALNPLLGVFADHKATGWKFVATGLVACVLGVIVPAVTSWTALAPWWPVFTGLAVALLALPALARRGRFRSGEMLVVVGMLLILGSVVSNGLNRALVPLTAGPAWLLRNQPALAPFAKEGVDPPFSNDLFLGLPEHGQADPNDPEYRYVIDGYHGGLSKREVVGHRAVVGWRDRAGDHRAVALSGKVAREREPGTFLDLDAPQGRAMDGQPAGARLRGPDGDDIEILSVTPPGIPWDQWLGAGLAWVPLIGAALVCSLAMAALVRQQWIVNERLPFPIAKAITSFLDEPRPGRRFAPVFSDRAFWIGFAIAAVVLTSQGLRTWGFTSISIPTNLAEVGPVSLAQVLRGGFWDQAYAGEWGLFQWRVYFSIVAITFFLPSDLGFSMWFFFVATNLVYVLLRSSGVPIEMHHASVAGMGGFLVQCLFILWIGRGYYLRLLKAAFVPAADPEIRVGAVYARALLLGVVALVVVQVAMGARVHHAMLATLINLGLLLVLARLVAEAGIPFVNTPTWWPVNAVIMSVTGVSAPAAALVPLILLGSTLCADPRENVLPFAVNAEYLGAKAKVPRLPWSALLLAVLAIGTVLSAIAMLVMNYHHDGQSARDGWWPHPMLSGLTPMATAASVGVDHDADTGNYIAYAVGALITGGLGIARLLLSWWPLHPIGYLISMTYATVMIWFSFFLGWMLKTMVMRFGGFALYERLKPVALGLIAGEAVVAGLFLVAGLVLPLFGITMPANPRFLPG